MAAGRAAECGAVVVILEKMKQVARKLCISGKGRCNITNMADMTAFIDHFPGTGRFLRSAFSTLFNDDLVSFFENNGLKVVTERGGRVFPASGKAPDVKASLMRWLQSLNVSVQTDVTVSSLLTEDGRVTGVIAGGRSIMADAVILATGGKSYPATGSTGDGYRLAKAVGHRIVPVRPALVPLETAGRFTGRMNDLNLRNIQVDLSVDGRRTARQFGELVFASFGVTGPTILTLSAQVVDALDAGRNVTLSLDLKPALDEKKLDARLIRDFSKRPVEPMHSVLRGLLPAPLVPVCLGMTGIRRERKPTEMKVEERRRLGNWLKNFPLEVTGYRPFSEAIVTAGGIDTSEVDPRTMESRKVAGLYLAGEVLDVQGDTGGYNLQAAFSTGWMAGACAAVRR
ncbi:MAG: NAD(P)/FAD-dependent oxidoreductase [Acidobacteria bacterium]|nr:NAD(P)/FAD-dependent oxidoreductase [Acidobacteriota bacterium]